MRILKFILSIPLALILYALITAGLLKLGLAILGSISFLAGIVLFQAPMIGLTVSFSIPLRMAASSGLTYKLFALIIPLFIALSSFVSLFRVIILKESAEIAWANYYRTESLSIWWQGFLFNLGLLIGPIHLTALSFEPENLKKEEFQESKGSVFTKMRILWLENRAAKTNDPERRIEVAQEAISLIETSKVIMFDSDKTRLIRGNFYAILGCAYNEQSFDFDVARNSRLAINALEKAESILEPKDTEQWILLHRYKAEAYSRRPEHNPNKNAQDAIKILESIYKHVKEYNNPELKTAYLKDLICYYSLLGLEFGSDGIEISLKLLNDEILALERNSDVREFAKFKFQLGSLYSRRIEGDKSLNTAKAVQLVNEGLNSISKVKYPSLYALGLLTLSEIKASDGYSSEKKADLKEALSLNSEILEIYATHKPDKRGDYETTFWRRTVILSKLDPEDVDDYPAEIERAFSESTRFFSKMSNPDVYGEIFKHYMRSKSKVDKSIFPI